MSSSRRTKLREAAPQDPTANPDGERIWLADTTFFWGLSMVDLLVPSIAMFGGRLRTTPAVLSELQGRVWQKAFLASAIEVVESGAVSIVKPTIAELRTVFDLRALWQCSPRDTNDLGEAEVIAIAGARGWHAVLDDRRARRTMQMRHGALECIDTPYVLLRLVDSGYCSIHQAWDHLNVMDRTGEFGHSFRGRQKSEWTSRGDYARVIGL